MTSNKKWALIVSVCLGLASLIWILDVYGLWNLIYILTVIMFMMSLWYAAFHVPSYLKDEQSHCDCGKTDLSINMQHNEEGQSVCSDCYKSWLECQRLSKAEYDHLVWIYKRMERVHMERDDIDYMIAFKKILDSRNEFYYMEDGEAITN